MGGVIGLFLIGVAAWYFGLFDAFSPTTYRAEVGYYEGTQQAWFVGSDKSREECTEEAARRFNAMNTGPLGKPGRAFSWACRKMQGENFLERVR